MRVALTGATGQIGHRIAIGLLAQGHAVVALGRRPSTLAGVEHRPHDLDGPVPDLSGMDALVHAAFSHVPGKYRGGEGDDPDGFVRRNLDGTRRLFAAAQALERVIFLSSRAVYGAYPAGTALTEDLPPLPDTLYGMVKVEAETALRALEGPVTVSLRATGVFGPAPPGQRHKWDDLFARFRAGQMPAPRIGTEVHGDDLADAVHLALTAAPERCAGGVFNLSDVVLDRRDLLRTYAGLTGIDGPLPPASDPATVSAMAPDRLRALGWRPGGLAAFPARLSEMIRGENPGHGVSATTSIT